MIPLTGREASGAFAEVWAAMGPAHGLCGGFELDTASGVVTCHCTAKFTPFAEPERRPS